MRKGIMIMGIALMATTMFSCKKEYTCKCEKVYITPTGSVSYADGSYLLKDNAVRAADECNKQETTSTDALGNYSRQCDID